MTMQRSKGRRAASDPAAEVRASQIALLDRLAIDLNAARRGRVAPDEAEALQLVEAIVTLPTTEPAPDAEAVYGRRLSPAAVRFNEVAAGVRVVMQVTQHIHPGPGGQLAHPSIRPVLPEHERLAVYLGIVRDAFFWREGWRLLKRCAQCERWFVDRSKNALQKRCSRACTWRYWNRPRRREKDHEPYRTRRRLAPGKGK